MDPTWLIFLLPLAAGSGWYFGYRKVVKVVNHEASSLPSAYFRGLNFLLNEQHDKALDVLVGALESHGDTVDGCNNRLAHGRKIAVGSLKVSGTLSESSRGHKLLSQIFSIDL